MYIYWIALINRRAENALRRHTLPVDYEDFFFRSIYRPRTLENAMSVNLFDVVYLLDVTIRIGLFVLFCDNFLAEVNFDS